MTFSIYEIILILTFVLFVLLPKKKNGLIGWGYFLGFAVLFELIITYYWAKFWGSNFIPFNFFALGCAAYYLYISYHFIRTKKIASLFRFLAISWGIGSVILFVLSLRYESTVNLVYVSGLFIAVLMVLLYFKDIAESKKFQDVTKMPYFYFSIGLLIFFTCNFPILCYFNLLISNSEANPEVANALSDILKIGNICLYLGYLLASICSIKIPRYIGSY